MEKTSQKYKRPLEAIKFMCVNSLILHKASLPVTFLENLIKHYQTAQRNPVHS